MEEGGGEGGVSAGCRRLEAACIQRACALLGVTRAREGPAPERQTHHQ